MHSLISARPEFDRRWVDAPDAPTNDSTTVDARSTGETALTAMEADRAALAAAQSQAAVCVAARTVAEVAARAQAAAAVATAAAAGASADAAASAAAVLGIGAARPSVERAWQEALDRHPLALPSEGTTASTSGGNADVAIRADAVNASVADATAADVEQASAADLADLVEHAVESLRAAASLASIFAGIAVEGELAAAALSAAASAATAARVVAAALDAKALVVAQAAAAAAEARRTEARLTHDVLHDDLTGLANRRLLVDRLTQALARSGRAGTSVAVLYLDLDGFKAVNDSLGHFAGDQLLIGVAHCLQRCLRDTDTCARVGGDEFVVLCEDLSHPSDGALVADRLQAALAAGVEVDGRALDVSVSIGISVGHPGAAPLELLKQADTAMYATKRRGQDARPVGAAR